MTKTLRLDKSLNSVSLPQSFKSLPSLSGTATNQLLPTLETLPGEDWKKNIVNKSDLLLDAKLMILKGKHETNTYNKEPGNPYQITTIKIGKRGMITFEYPGNDTVNLLSALDFSLNELYPVFDKNVGGQIYGEKELAEYAGYAKRRDKTGKDLASYQPRTMDKFKANIELASKVQMDIRNVPFKVISSKTSKTGKTKRIPRIIELKGGGTLLSYVSDEKTGKYIFTPHPIVSIHAYGQTLDKARELYPDKNIERIKQRNYYSSIKPSMRDRKIAQGETCKNHYNLLDRFANKKKPTRCFDILRDFRVFYPTKNEWEFRRKWKKNQSVYCRLNGGDWYFTDRLDKAGKSLGKNKWCNRFVMDYTTHKLKTLKTVSITSFDDKSYRK